MKNQIKTLLAAFLLLLLSCTREPLVTPATATTQSAADAAVQLSGFSVGQHYGGGVIFFLDSTRLHGLIADTADLGSFPWYNDSYLVTGATAVRLGSGRKNTKKIILAQGKNGSYAALECAKSKRGGYADWYLPSKIELDRLQRLKYVVGGFANKIYWSSSEDYDHAAWYQNFGDGKQGTDFKNSIYLVRAIRSF